MSQDNVGVNTARSNTKRWYKDKRLWLSMGVYIAMGQVLSPLLLTNPLLFIFGLTLFMLWDMQVFSTALDAGIEIADSAWKRVLESKE